MKTFFGLLTILLVFGVGSVLGQEKDRGEHQMGFDRDYERAKDRDRAERNRNSERESNSSNREPAMALAPVLEKGAEIAIRQGVKKAIESQLPHLANEEQERAQKEAAIREQERQRQEQERRNQEYRNAVKGQNRSDRAP